MSTWGYRANNDTEHYGGWGEPTDSGYTGIYSNRLSFTAQKPDGSVNTWGSASFGANAQPTGTGYTNVWSNDSVYVAAKADGSLVSWGYAASSNPPPTGTGYEKVFPNFYGFVAMKADGSLHPWGNTYPVDNPPTETGYVHVVGTNYGGFAALHQDGSIAVWGRAGYGGTDGPSGDDFVNIVGNSEALVALREDGSIVQWGFTESHYIDPPTDDGYVHIQAGARAFVAMKADGSLKSWGHSHYATGVPTDNGYVSVISNEQAFAALKADGSISTWGTANHGGDNGPTGSGYKELFATRSAFAALHTDGSVFAWGYEGGGGEPTGNNVVSISSHFSGFAALLDDGSIKQWGLYVSGSDVVPTDSGYTTINGRGPGQSSNCATPYAANFSPELSGTPVAVHLQNSNYSFTPTVSDYGDSGWTFSISNKPAWASFDTSTGTLSGIPNNSHVGSYSGIRITATDSGGKSGSLADFSITVQDVNDPPHVANALIDRSVAEDSNVSFQLPANSFDDVDPNSTLTLSIVGVLPDWLSFNASTRTFSGTPDNDDVGAAVITVKASDGQASTDDSFVLTVTNVNDAPTLSNALVDKTATEDTGFAFVVPSNTFSDVDKNTTLALSIDGALPSWLVFYNNTGLFSGTPLNAHVGVSNITVQASDGTASVTDTFALTVLNSNDAPVVSNPVADQNATEDVAYSFVVPNNAFTDPDVGDTLSYSVSSTLPDWLSFDAATRTFSGTPDNDDVGGSTITLNASDGTVDSNDVFVIRVLNANDAPTLDNALNAQTATQGETFYFAVPLETFSDVDAGDTLSLSLINNPTWLSYNANTRTLSGTPGVSDVGSQTVQVRATDSSGATVQAGFTLTVLKANSAPVVDKGISDPQALSDQLFSYTLPNDVFRDPDSGDTLQLSLVMAPTWLSLDQGVLSGTPSTGDIDLHRISVRATDPQGLLVDTFFNVDVQRSDSQPPVFNSSGTATVDENTSTDFYTAIASDSDSVGALSYSLDAGGSAALFSLDSTTGKLRFVTAPDYENPTDNGNNNSYALTLRASDSGGNSSTLALVVQVLDSNDNAPLFSSASTHSVTEGVRNTAYIAQSSDSDSGDTVRYTLSAGDDSVLFEIDPDSGLLQFANAPDFEAPQDKNTDNVYELVLRATDAAGNSSTHALQITVSDSNDSAPLFSSATSVQVIENTASDFYQAQAVDADAQDAVQYSLGTARDEALFSLDASSGQLRFIAAPDYENPSNGNSDNLYLLDLIATDSASQSRTLTLAVQVQDLNDNAPSFQSGSSTTATEGNLVTGYTAFASDPDTADAANNALSYSISGGADAALFSVHAQTGLLSFLSKPDYEVPGDANGDNVYEVQLLATDQALQSTTLDLSLALSDSNDNAPLFSSSAKVDITEGSSGVFYTAVATDQDSADAVVYSISAGNDDNLFSLDANSGALSSVALDREQPAASSINDLYVLTLRATDDAGHENDFTLAVKVLDINDNAPVFSSDSSVQVPENTRQTELQFKSSDADLNDSVSYSIVPGLDAALFEIDSNQRLLFSVAPDYEQPSDAGSDNSYSLVVRASDDAGNNTDQTVSVQVTNLNDTAPVFSSGTTASVDEGSTASPYTAVASDNDSGDSVSYAIVGGNDGALFTIDSSSGELAFSTVPDAEQPLDHNSDNTYALILRAQDSLGNHSEISLSITVSDINDSAPVFSSGDSASVSEGSTATAYTAVATDPDAQDTVVYSLAADKDHTLFNLDATSGELTFKQAVDYDNPQDSNGNNHYKLTLVATDALGHSTNQDFILTVLDRNDEAPVFQTAAQVSAQEGSTQSFVELHVSDQDAGDHALFGIVGGSDAALFRLDGVSGGLSFRAEADFEVPGDNDQDNVYQLTVRATDSAGNQTEQAMQVTMTDINEKPVASEQSFRLGELTAVGTVVGQLIGADPEGDNLQWSLINAGSPFSLSNTGELSVSGPLDYEQTPSYRLGLELSDGSLMQHLYVQIIIDNESEVLSVVEVRPVDVALLTANGITGAIAGREAYYANALDSNNTPSTVAELQWIIDQANAVATAVELALSDRNPGTDEDSLLLQTLAQAGVVNTKIDMVSAYRTAIQNAQPTPSSREELQLMVDQLNGRGSIYATAKAVYNGELAASTLGALLVDYHSISDELLPELAAMIAQANPPPLTKAAINALIDKLVTRAQEQPVMYLVLEQAGRLVTRVQQELGPVTVIAVVSNIAVNPQMVFDWGESSVVLRAAASSATLTTNRLVFDPVGIDDSEPLAARTVVNYLGTQSSASLDVLFLEEGVDPSEAEDSDSDGISDRFDGELEASADPSVVNKLQSVREEDIKYVLETEANYQLRLGALSRRFESQAAGLAYQVLLEKYPSAALDNDVFIEPSMVLDYELVRLPRVGSSALVVVPLLAPVPANGVYRHYGEAVGWQDFSSNNLNKIWSAAALSDGLCPPAGHTAYVTGLRQGDGCVQLMLEDGGPNDADSLQPTGMQSDDSGVNGMIRHTGAVMVIRSDGLGAGGNESGKDTAVQTGLNGGGGALWMLWIILLWHSIVVLPRAWRKPSDQRSLPQ